MNAMTLLPTRTLSHKLADITTFPSHTNITWHITLKRLVHCRGNGTTIAHLTYSRVWNEIKSKTLMYSNCLLSHFFFKTRKPLNCLLTYRTERRDAMWDKSVWRCWLIYASVMLIRLTQGISLWQPGQAMIFLPLFDQFQAGRIL